jgi:hypothetical protein
MRQCIRAIAPALCNARTVHDPVALSSGALCANKPQPGAATHHGENTSIYWIDTADKHDRSLPVTCPKRTCMAEKAKNASEIVN